jgi:hypothetical protein
MRRPSVFLSSIAAALCLALGLAACGESDPAGVGGTSLVSEEAVEGEPLELGELSYNVQITRFLNPDDPEDEEYLVGLPPAEPGTSYLGVFMVIENESEEPLASASDFTVVDTLHEEFELVESESPYALEIGAEVPAEGELAAGARSISPPIRASTRPKCRPGPEPSEPHLAHRPLRARC